MWRRRNTALADFPRKHAQTICFFGRRPVDISTGGWRVSDNEIFGRPVIITNSDFRFIVAEQLRECNVEADIVLEPMRRDSALAVAIAASLAAARDPAAIVLILAADHVLRDSDAFIKACAEAAAVAAEGRIVTFGINATTPATSYGYIRPGAILNGGTARSVEAFVEKPDAQTAGRYVAEHYLWNSGNFAFRADVMLAEIARLEPEIAEAARASVGGLTRDLDFLRLPDEPFRRAPKKSSITQSWSAPTSPPCCRLIAAGRMSVAGAQFGTFSITMRTAMPQPAQSYSTTAETVWRDPTRRS